MRAGEQKYVAEKACDQSHAQHGYACLARLLDNEVLEDSESRGFCEADSRCQRVTRIIQRGVKDVEISKIDTEITADDRCDGRRTQYNDADVSRRSDDGDEDL